MTSNENEQNLNAEELERIANAEELERIANAEELERIANAEELEPSSSADSQSAYENAKSIAEEAFAQLDESTRSSFASLRIKFEEAQNKLFVANAEYGKTWRELPDDVQKSLAKATRKKPTAATSDFLELKPEEFPMEKFDAAIRARRQQLQAREFFRRDRAKFRDPLIDRFLLSCSGSDSICASFPSDEFEAKAVVLKNLQLCESVDDAKKRAEDRWKFRRPCVVANSLREWVEGETKKTRRKRFRKIKRQMFREFANSDDWKEYASSIAAIVRSLIASTICVVLLWLAIFKWNLVYLLRYESIFPYKSDAYRFLYIMTPVVWVAFAFFYRKVVLFRLKFRSTFKKFKKEIDEAAEALK